MGIIIINIIVIIYLFVCSSRQANVPYVKQYCEDTVTDLSEL